ncbi:uncharacterized protein LOC141647203 [Silene latifolia]|uniref:uncharacterized protein LOC141647203 n=1 Tax=Silene latifolia TaxID=37657 RepID=UPI003D76B5C9
MAGDLFGDLPPPSYHHPTPPQQQQEQKKQKKSVKINEANPSISDTPISPPIVPLKSALKRPIPPSDSTSNDSQKGPERRLKFKTITDTSVAQTIEAMKKIASHISNPAKFSKASKLVIQLIQAGSVKPETTDHFFAILEAAMLSPTSCNDASIRADYQTLFSAAQDASECLSKKQKNLLAAWAIRAVVANDLHTDDSFVFSKAAGRIKELISSLPVATEEEDANEAAALESEKEMAKNNMQTNQEVISSDNSPESTTKEESDPFGLDALISSKPKKDEKAKGNKGKEEAEEMKGLLKLRREALTNCLEIAAKRYKLPWCQTVIDILVKHANDNVSRFTAKQREAIEKLWASIREQLTRRKQGKSVSGKLDVTAFEYLQEKYSHETISIRRAVGGTGDRKASQWLG